MINSNNTDRINEIISITAYHFYEQRGKESGHELEDWLKAESMIAPIVAAPPVPTIVKRPSLRELAGKFIKNKSKSVDISVNTDI